MTLYTDPEALARAKSEAINALRAEAERLGYQHDSEYYAQLLRDDDARVARGEATLIDPLIRDYVENFRQRRTPEEREQARIAAQDLQLARDEAAGRWKRFIAEPTNVDKLIALVEQAPAPEPTVAPWLRREP